MPDLTRGHTFTSGEEVDHTKLNNLVGNASINDSAVTEVKVAANAIINSKISASAAIALSKLASGSSGQVIVGASGDGVPTYRTVAGDVTISEAGATVIGADKVLTANVLNANITTAKIADNAVTADKLADTAVTAAAYTNASITVDAQGRLTAASNGGAVDHPTARLQGFAADGTWTAPAGVIRAKFTVVGAGGSGCATTNESGGGGGCAIVSAVVVPATGYAITVGEGVNQANPSNGRAGEDSTVVVGATTYTGGGGGGASTASDGTGGTGTNGDVNFAGAAGAADEALGGGYSFLGPVHGRGSHSSATSNDGFVLVEWVE